MAPYHLDGNCVKTGTEKGEGKTVKCHKTRQEAEDHLRALYKNVPDAKNSLSISDMENELAELAPRGSRIRLYFQEGEQSLDRRVIDINAINFNRPPPYSLTLQTIRAEGHQGAVVCGVIDKVMRDGTVIVSEGRLDLNGEGGREAERLIREGILQTWSPDLADAVIDIEENTEDEDGQDPTQQLAHFVKATFNGGTLVPMPALASAVVELLDDEGNVIVPAPKRQHDTADQPVESVPAQKVERQAGSFAEQPAPDKPPVEDELLPETVHEQAIRLGGWRWATEEEDFGSKVIPNVGGWRWTTDPDALRDLAVRLGGWRWSENPSDDPVSSLTKLLGGWRWAKDDEERHEMALALLGGWRWAVKVGGWRWSEVETNSIASGGVVSSVQPYIVGEHGQEMFIPGSSGNGTLEIMQKLPTPDEMLSPISACAGPANPPASFFAKQPLPELQRWVEVTADGHVYGHAAGFGECHIGYLDQCVTIEMIADCRGEGFFEYAMPGHVLTAEGTKVATGPIAVKGGHAPKGADYIQAMSHYDDPSFVVADVCYYVDEHGVQFSGALRSTATEAQVQALRASGVSLDARQIGGKLRYLATCAVNTPGFPKASARVIASGDQQEVIELIAAGGAPKSAPDSDCGCGELTAYEEDREANKKLDTVLEIMRASGMTQQAIETLEAELPVTKE